MNVKMHRIKRNTVFLLKKPKQYFLMNEQLNFTMRLIPIGKTDFYYSD